MTEPEPVESIVPRILERYNESPRGWRILHTRLGDMLVVGPESSYQLRLIPLSPQTFTGAGIEIDGEDKAFDRIRSTPEFGLRSITDEDLKNLLQAMSNPEAARPQLQEIIRRAPIIPTDLDGSKSSHLLSGPVLMKPDLNSLSSNIIRVQRELDSSAREIFRKKYPMRAGMFF